MFKSILPHEAQLSRQSKNQMDSHLQYSAFSPLANAMHTSATKLTASIKRLARKHQA